MQLRLTGGSANNNPNVSLGGAMSSTEVTTAILNNLWDNVGGIESRDGDIEYRCLALYNQHGTANMINSRVYVLSNTTSANDEVDIGFSGSVPVNTDESINNGTNESLAPAGVTFTHPTDLASALNTGDILPGYRRYLWSRRTVQPGAAAQANNTYSLRITAETT